MSEHDNLKIVFTGSILEANYIKSLLEENGIAAMVRNTIEESFAAGWASGMPGDAGLVYVIENHEEESKMIIEEYLGSK